MQTHVISLKNQHQRRAHMTQELGKQNIDFTFFDAIEGHDIARISHNLGLQVAQNTQLSQGEKGCLLSHVSLWQKMCDENLPHITILEDDIFLGQNAAAFLNSGTWLHDKPIELLKIETFLQNKILHKWGGVKPI